MIREEKKRVKDSYIEMEIRVLPWVIPWEVWTFWTLAEESKQLPIKLPINSHSNSISQWQDGLGGNLESKGRELRNKGERVTSVKTELSHNSKLNVSSIVIFNSLKSTNKMRITLKLRTLTFKSRNHVLEIETK